MLMLRLKYPCFSPKRCMCSASNGHAQGPSQWASMVSQEIPFPSSSHCAFIKCCTCSLCVSILVPISVPTWISHSYQGTVEQCNFVIGIEHCNKTFGIINTCLSTLLCGTFWTTNSIRPWGTSSLNSVNNNATKFWYLIPFTMVENYAYSLGSISCHCLRECPGSICKQNKEFCNAHPIYKGWICNLIFSQTLSQIQWL